MRLALILSVVMTLLITTNLTSAVLVDDVGIMANHEQQANDVIKDLYQSSNVNLWVSISKDNFDDTESFRKFANYLQSTQYALSSNLHQDGNEMYNVLIFYANVNGKPRIGYVYSNLCEPVTEVISELREGDLGEELSGQEMLDIITKLASGLKDAKEEYKDDCGIKISEGEIVIKKYDNAYIIDDTNWKNVLKMIPISIRHFVPDTMKSQLTEEQQMLERKKHIKYTPLLVYHREGESFDVESTKIFLKQFNPTRRILVRGNENPPNNLQGALEYTDVLPANDFPRKWKNIGYDSIVISEDDYATGLVASLWASYTNSPLIFSSAELEKYEGYQKVYCIGSVKNSGCTDSYTVTELQKYYQDITGTDKVILVNPSDIKESSCESLPYNTENGYLTYSHCKDSLVAPILASSKNELIVAVDSEPLSEGMMKNTMFPENTERIFMRNDGKLYLQFYSFGKNKIGLYDIANNDMEDIFATSDEIVFAEISENENMYLALSNGDIVKISGNSYQNIFNVDSSVVMSSSDFIADGKDNVYFLSTGNDISITKYNIDGISSTQIFSKEIIDDSLKKSKYLIKNTKLFYKDDFIYLVVITQPHTSASERNVLVYKFDEKIVPNNELNEDILFASYTIPNVEKIKSVKMSDSKDLYFLINSTRYEFISVVKGANLDYSVVVPSNQIDQSLHGSTNFILYKNGVVAAIDFNKLPSGKYVDILTNARRECYFHSLGLNDEKKKFENEIDTKYSEIKESFVESAGEINYKYLTIISSPLNIPSSSYFHCKEYDEIRKQLDSTYLDSASTGRIFGITVSDSAGYVARVISFSENGSSFVPSSGGMGKFNSIFITASSFTIIQKYVPDFAKKFTDEGYNVECKVDSENLTKNGCSVFDKNKKDYSNLYIGKDIIIYDDHGKVSELSHPELLSREIGEVSSQIAIVDACETGDYYSSKVENGLPNLFASNFIRKGGLGYYGAVSVTISTYFSKNLPKLIFSGYDLGNSLSVLLKYKDFISVFEKITGSKGTMKPNYMLFGDPTVKPALLKEISLDSSAKSASENYNCEIKAGKKVCERDPCQFPYGDWLHKSGELSLCKAQCFIQCNFAGTTCSDICEQKYEKSSETSSEEAIDNEVDNRKAYICSNIVVDENSGNVETASCRECKEMETGTAIAWKNIKCGPTSFLFIPTGYEDTYAVKQPSFLNGVSSAYVQESKEEAICVTECKNGKSSSDSEDVLIESNDVIKFINKKSAGGSGGGGGGSGTVANSVYIDDKFKCPKDSTKICCPSGESCCELTSIGNTYSTTCQDKCDKNDKISCEMDYTMRDENTIKCCSWDTSKIACSGIESQIKNQCCEDNRGKVWRKSDCLPGEEWVYSISGEECGCWSGGGGGAGTTEELKCPDGVEQCCWGTGNSFCIYDELKKCKEFRTSSTCTLEAKSWKGVECCSWTCGDTEKKAKTCCVGPDNEPWRPGDCKDGDKYTWSTNRNDCGCFEP